MRILIVEDNRDILANITDYLELKGFTVDCAYSGLMGLHLASTESYDLIILDIMLPGMDGNQICTRLREDIQSTTPIIMLTARDTLDDKLLGLNNGADDYLIKPFALKELEARIHAILRRSHGGIKRQLEVADLSFDLDTLDIKRQNKTIKLNPTGQKILKFLMQKSPTVVKRSDLEHEIWGDNSPDSDSLRSHIHQLRQNIDKPFKNSKPLIHTQHSVGYCVMEKTDEE